MAWIEIDAGVYALEPTPDPVEVVVLADLDAEIAKCRGEIAEIEVRRLAAPKDASQEIANAVAAWNEMNHSLGVLPGRISELEALRARLLEG